ncbi:MAG: ABC transporter ATP-binding protein [Candidatus Brocadiia bacterium]
MNDAVLEMEGVTKTYRPDGRSEVVALDSVSLKVEPGKFKVICGPSGSGKTTLLLTAGGLQRPESGTVRVNGEDIYRYVSEERACFRAENVGFVFQQFHLIAFLNVLENILVPTLAMRNQEAREKAFELIELFGLADRINHPPGELSTGERQRVALARALLNEPGLVLADEPTGNLDARNAEAVLGYLNGFTERGGAVLLATHDTRIEADEKFNLEDGQLVNHAGGRVH